MLSQAELQSLLRYEPHTGQFIRLVRTAPSVRVGDVAGGLDAHGYVVIRLHGRSYKAHRLVWLYVHGRLPKHDIDHINGVRTDNRIANLREATRAQNSRNAGVRRDSRSGIKGVYWCKAANKWAAHCRMNGALQHLGVYQSREEAKTAYISFAKKAHGEFFAGTRITE